jgi:hypothetical protein
MVRLEPFPFRLNRHGSSISLFDAFSEREPVSTSRENAVRAREKEMVVNKVTWAQAGRVTKPGRYMFRFGWLTITEEDIAIWEQHPNAAFVLLRIPAAEADDEFHLGTFDVGGNAE